VTGQTGLKLPPRGQRPLRFHDLRKGTACGKGRDEQGT